MQPSSDSKASSIAPIAIPRDHMLGHRKPWDAPVPVHLADSLNFSWKLTGSQTGGFKTATALKVRTVRSKEPTTVSVQGSWTTDDVKGALARALHVSSRKVMTLSWYGTELEDGKSLDQLRVPEGAALDLSLRSRSQTELDALKAVKHVLIVEGKGENAVHLDGLSPATQVAQIKATMKAPPTASLYHSPVFTSGFGAALVDERTLGSYCVLGAPARGANPLARAGSEREAFCAAHPS